MNILWLSSKKFNLISLGNGTKENSKCSIIILMGFSQTPRIFKTFFELIRRNNKASLVNMLVTFSGKLECSFLTAPMLFLYLHSATTAKVPRPKKFFWPADMQGNKKFMTFRFNSVLTRFQTLLFIFVSLGLQSTHLSHDKNDVINLLSCDITPIFFNVRNYTKLETSLPPPTPLTLFAYRK